MALLLKADKSGKTGRRSSSSRNLALRPRHISAVRTPRKYSSDCK